MMNDNRNVKKISFFVRNQVQKAFMDLIDDLASTEKFWRGVDDTFAEEVRFGEAVLIFHEDKPMVSIADTNIQWCEHLNISIDTMDYTDFGGPHKGPQEEEVRTQIANMDRLIADLTEARSKLSAALENVKE